MESTNITNSVEYEANMLESDIGYKGKLKYIHKYNANKIILAHVDINSMRSKLYSLIDQVNENADVLMFNERKPDENFPKSQFLIQL